MASANGSQLFNSPPHSVNIYLPAAPTRDSGGGVKNNWPIAPSQSNVPCSINTNGASTSNRQMQENITVGNRIGILTSVLSVTLVRGTKMIATDTGRTFIVTGLCSPNRPYGATNDSQTIPALTYIDAIEIL